MIRSSSVAKGIALTLSATFLIGGMHLAQPGLNVEMEGGGEPVEARMGTAFEDMAVGTLTAQNVSDMPQTPQPILETARQMNATKTQKPQAVETPRAQPMSQTPAPQPKETARPEPQQVTPPHSTLHLAAPAPDAAVPDAVMQTPSPPTDTPRVMQRHSTPVAPAKPEEPITAEAPDNTAPPLSVRPRRRDPEKAAQVAAARPVPTPTPTPTRRSQPKTQPKRGNAQRNNTQGAENGSNEHAKAKAQGSTRQASAQAGNAAASNYPGQVMRKISRVRKPNLRARGTATIAFRIAASGGLSGISVARSSGSSELDQAALRVVQRAAPFPRPPAGAGRNFSIEIKGR